MQWNPLFNELAHKMNMDPARIRELNMPMKAKPMYDYDGNLNSYSKLYNGSLPCPCQGDDRLG